MNDDITRSLIGDFVLFINGCSTLPVTLGDLQALHTFSNKETKYKFVHMEMCA